MSVGMPEMIKIPVGVPQVLWLRSLDTASSGGFVVKVKIPIGLPQVLWLRGLETAVLWLRGQEPPVGIPQVLWIRGQDPDWDTSSSKVSSCAGLKF